MTLIPTLSTKMIYVLERRRSDVRFKEINKTKQIRIQNLSTFISHFDRLSLMKPYKNDFIVSSRKLVIYYFVMLF